jgi:hypothetical protein
VPYLQAIDLDKDELVQAIALSAFVSTVALALGLGLNSGLSTAAPAGVDPTSIAWQCLHRIASG